VFSASNLFTLIRGQPAQIVAFVSNPAPAGKKGTPKMEAANY